MTAQEARNITEANTAANVGKVLEAIRQAAQKGESRMRWYEPISGDVKRELKLLGYTVHATEWHRNEPSTIIDW